MLPKYATTGSKEFTKQDGFHITTLGPCPNSMVIPTSYFMPIQLAGKKKLFAN